eukprot:1154852-Pelagomonas_calceolata.AAC.2
MRERSAAPHACELKYEGMAMCMPLGHVNCVLAWSRLAFGVSPAAGGRSPAAGDVHAGIK